MEAQRADGGDKRDQWRGCTSHPTAGHGLVGRVDEAYGALVPSDGLSLSDSTSSGGLGQSLRRIYAMTAFTTHQHDGVADKVSSNRNVFGSNVGP